LIALFVMLRRFVRAIVDAWSSDVAFRILLALIHPSAWNMNSRKLNFRFTEF
jgi:hypothetical protein